MNIVVPPPAASRAATVLPAARWLPLAEAHATRADGMTAAHRARKAVGRRHPIDDFLYDYYGTKPSLLRRWHPGAGIALGPAPDGPAEHTAWRWYATDDDGTVRLDVQAFLADRGDTVRFVRTLLAATADRPAHTGCLGLHEWAMVYRQDDARRRHTLPLRLGRAGTDAVVEAHPLRCSHFDAFRFFTPDAVPRNRVQLTRADQVGSEQPGCLHANMDLLCRQTDSPDDAEPPPLTRQTQVLYEQPGCLHANMDLLCRQTDSPDDVDEPPPLTRQTQGDGRQRPESGSGSATGAVQWGAHGPD